MENVNEKNATEGLNVASNPNKRLILKSVAIGVITLLLLIPIKMVESLIEEREQTAKSAMSDVFEQWGGEQLIIAPNIQYDWRCHYINKEGEKEKIEYYDRRVTLLPENLHISGTVNSQQLKRGIYEIVTYNSPIEITGDFVFTGENIEDIEHNVLHESVKIAISDIKGITEEVKLTLGNDTYTLTPNGESILSTKEFSASINLKTWTLGEKVPFKLILNLKGSQALKFLPIGKETVVSLTSNCHTPSFCGNFLPTTREVKADGFMSEWKISYVNRSYPQVIIGDIDEDGMRESEFGVNLLIPVQHYQKTLRCVKYAELFVILTFVLFFFIEIIQKKRVHPIQYTLVGLALTLFYSLLLSMSEHIGFVSSYWISAIMTVVLITLYTAGVLKIRKTAAYIGASLLGLYTYIFILIRMETYALLAGSLGLFVILAVLMYLSQRINWSKAE